jgi:hypothetical protein
MYGHLRGAACVQEEIHLQRANGGVEAEIFRHKVQSSQTIRKAGLITSAVNMRRST